MNSITYSRRSNGRVYAIALEGDYLKISHKEQTRVIKCIHNSTYSIKHNKRTLSGIGGADGIFETLKDFIEKDFATIYVNAVIDKLYPEHKEKEER